MQTFLTDTQTTDLIHVLAAHQHRYRSLLTSTIRKLAETRKQPAYNVIHDDLPMELARELRRATDAAKWIFSSIAGEADAVDTEQVQAQKFYQLQVWVINLDTAENRAYTDWAQRMNVPFLDLSPEEQLPAYQLAWQDLPVLSKAHSRELPQSPPVIEPMRGVKLGLRKGLHRGNVHGKYAVSEQPWSKICQLCNASFSMV